MIQTPRPLLVLHRDAGFRERVRAAAARGESCSFYGDWEALHAAIAAAPPSALLVVDPYAGDGSGELSPQLRSLLWEFPSSTVLVAMELRRGCSHDIRTLGEWGVSDVIGIGEEDTPDGIALRLRAAQGRPLQNLLQRSLPPTVSARARTLLMSAAEIVANGGRGRDLARALHLSERSVLRWSRRAGLPPPRRLMAWMRVLLAASLLDDPGRTVLSVAHACGYASDSSLRRAMQDFLGTVPTGLRREGAFLRASRMFLQELGRMRL
jgi:AraC-like DNA-binding protein